MLEIDGTIYRVKVRKQRQPVDLEAMFIVHLKAAKVPRWRREFMFHSTRRWKFDFAWPELMVACEIEGGTGWKVNGKSIRGSHVTPLGYRKDCMKYSEGAIAGWCVVRGDAKMVKDGTLLRLVELAIAERMK